MAKAPTAVLLAASVLGAACSRTTITAPPEDRTEEGLAVTGIGRVEARPDTLTVSIGVVSRGESAEEALVAVTRGARALLKAVGAEGVAEADIRTVSLRVSPVFERGEIVGYVAEERFRVKIRDLERAGDVVGAAVRAAGDDVRVSGMSLEVADPDAALQEARKRAIEDAIRRAEELTAAAGVRLGAPLSIEEVESEEPAPFALAETVGAAGAEAAAAISAEIEPGTREIRARVLVRFRIRG